MAEPMIQTKDWRNPVCQEHLVTVVAVADLLGYFQQVVHLAVAVVD
jgi:hypothetical protein